MCFNGKSLKISDKKKTRNIIVDLSKNATETPGPQSHHLNIALLNSKN